MNILMMLILPIHEHGTCFLLFLSSSFPVWMPVISFSYLFAVARSSNTMLNKSGESRHPCLVSDLKGNTFSFCPLSMILAIDFSYMAFIMWRYAPSIPTLLSVFIINGCWILSNALFCIYWYDHMIFVFHFVYGMCITFIDLWIFYHPYIPGINCTWLWYMIFLMYCWIQFASILWKILASMLIRDIGL